MLQEFYGRRIRKTADLRSGACCTDETAQRYAEILELLPAEVRERHYGCGCPLPVDDLTGLTVLDLGAGAGVDAFIALKCVGPTGFLHGIDMTPEQLDVARRNARPVAERFGHASTNIAFHEGFIETADAIPDASVDLVISDCVINLSPAKEEVFRTVWRVLKPGGEMYISDIAADRRVPESIRSDPLLVAECLGGAEYEHDWFDTMRDAGFMEPRVVSRSLVQEEALGQPVRFSSLTVRAFKLYDMERRCEDYGQLATYRGSLPQVPARFVLDDHHVFEAQRPAPVCRNTARMLTETRLGAHFEITPPIRHFGLFDCGPTASAAPSSGGSCC
ncbi:MAG: methyltransferase domain-containing protein [Candidatus Latescibacterota bacterium]|nr:MAG: methyltransferase domain-containing protein [Candidatus Latescibacterota bacterium]